MGCSQSAPKRNETSDLHIVANSFSNKKEVKDANAKVVILGNSGVGKSSIALRACHGRFNEEHQVTIGGAFLNHTVHLKNGVTVHLNIWDTAGQERFRSMGPLYYRDALGAIIVYDSNNVESFDSLPFWVNEIKSKGERKCRIIIVANKKDLPKNIQPEVVMKFCEQEQVPFIECSARTGENVSVLFEKIASYIYVTFKDIHF